MMCLAGTGSPTWPPIVPEAAQVLSHLMIHRTLPIYPPRSQDISPQPLATSFESASHLLYLCQEGISQISGWLVRVPGGPILSQQVIQYGHEGLLTLEDHVSQPWDAQEYWELIKYL